MLFEKQITLKSKLVTHTEVGIRIETLMEKPGQDLPLICKYVYMLDDMKFQAWCEKNQGILDGILSVICVKGIRILIPQNGKGARTGFTIESDNGMFPIPLLDGPVTFVVHRDSISPKEWIVLVEDPASAAHSRIDG